MQPWKISVGLTAIIMRRSLDARRRELFVDRTLLLDRCHRSLDACFVVRRSWPWSR